MYIDKNKCQTQEIRCHIDTHTPIKICVSVDVDDTEICIDDEKIKTCVQCTNYTDDICTCNNHYTNNCFSKNSFTNETYKQFIVHQTISLQIPITYTVDITTGETTVS